MWFPLCSKRILCGLSAQSQTAGRFLCFSSRTSLGDSQFNGQTVEDKRFWIWTLWTPQGSFSQVSETTQGFKAKNAWLVGQTII